MSNKAMLLRGVVGVLAISLALKRIISISNQKNKLDTLRFDFKKYDKNTSMISIVNFGWIKPKKGDLVLVHNQCEYSDLKYVFRIVEQMEHTYTHQRNGFRVWIPDGFLLLHDPINDSHEIVTEFLFRKHLAKLLQLSIGRVFLEEYNDDYFYFVYI